MLNQAPAASPCGVQPALLPLRKNAIRRARVRSSPSNCVREGGGHTSIIGLARRYVAIALITFTEQEDWSHVLQPQPTTPLQLPVIMASIDERLSPSLQKMTFHWVLVQKSNDLPARPTQTLT